MSIGTPARTAGLLVLSLVAAPLAAQQGAGDGFLFRPPPGSLTLFGGFAAPFASGGVHELATRELTLDRGDFGVGSWGGELAIGIRPRYDLVLAAERSRSVTPSEYRDWVDNLDQPIRQTTRFDRVPLSASVRYYLRDRGRQIGSVAWIPAQFVPFVQAGAGVTRYRFEQQGDFIDQQTLNVFTDRLTSTGWARTFSLGAGAQWNLNQRYLVTAQARYLNASGDGDAPNGEFAGYRVDLSGVSTVIGFTVRF
ncbi:MAG: hypothetical protein IPJ78_09920 [Gemmatimonadetes bacterium]|nr:hypothetical protein [Gemmatimonadota bacterium]